MDKITVLAVIAVLIASSLVYAEVALPPISTEEVLAKKKTDLNNTEWTIEVKPMGGKGKAENDTIVFTDGQVVSKEMEQSGYVPTNFSVRLLEDETFTWETMQTSEKDGVAFWRGDIGPDGIMRGVISKRDNKNKTSDFNFVSVNMQKIAPVLEPSQPAVVQE